MVKYNYFEQLEKLSELARSAVTLACGSQSATRREEFSSIRRACDRSVCELEDALFSDFLPPLERDNLAACAHALSRVVDAAAELCHHPATLPTVKQNEESAVCVKLAESLSEAVSMLKRIRKPDEIPDRQGFRKLLSEGRCAHNAMLSKLHAGALPRSSAQTIIQVGRLRAELSRAFDELVEIMLNNI